MSGDEHTNETRELNLDDVEAHCARGLPSGHITVGRLVAEVRRLRDPDVMLAALVDAGRLYTTTNQEGDASSVVTTLEYHGFRIIDQRGAGVSS